MNRKGDMLVLSGAVVGGLAGCMLFFWLVHHGFYAMILPGGLCGLGAGVFKRRSNWVPVVCGLLALGLAFFTEWRSAPFLADGSFGFFVLHIHQLSPVTLVLVGVGTWIGFWVPFRRVQEERSSNLCIQNEDRHRN
jgi:hypothetical protein